MKVVRFIAIAALAMSFSGQATQMVLAPETEELKSMVTQELATSIATMNDVADEIKIHSARELASLHLQLTLEELLGKAKVDLDILAALPTKAD